MSDINAIYSSTTDAMEKSLVRLEEELTKIRAGRANVSMLDSVKVDYYGAPTGISQVANITATDARTLKIQPWEKQMLDPISTAIINSNLGYNPQNNGEVIIISIPQLTEERRKEFVKKVKAAGEFAKVAVRNSRKDAMEAIKKLEKDGLSEDEAKDGEGRVQKITDDFSARVDKICDAKEVDIMKI